MEPSGPNSEPTSRPAELVGPTNGPMPSSAEMDPVPTPAPLSPQVDTSGPAPVYSAPQPVAGQTYTSVPPVSPLGDASGKSKRGLLFLVALVAALMLLVGGSYVFGLYLPNRPAAIFATSLERSGKAADALVAYSKTATAQQYKSYKLNGTLTIINGTASFDATLKGAFDPRANADVTLNMDALGSKISADIRSNHVANSASPDVYVRLSGIKSALDSYGLASLDSLDGEWVSIDHTLADTLAAGHVNQAAAGVASMPTPAQLYDGIAKMQTVSKQYLFTANASTAVFKQSKYIGKETKDGHSTYHYKVGYNKDHLAAYVDALGGALDKSQLNDWSKASGGKSISDLLVLSDLSKDAKSTSGNYTFDAWVDTKTKLFQSIQFTDPSDSGTVVAISQNYAGGDVYPFGLSVSSKDGDQTVMEALKLNLNTKTNVSDGTVTIKSSGYSGDIKFTLTPSNDSLQVTVPANAVSITTLMNQLGLR
jgi:hypothetical protein